MLKIDIEKRINRFIDSSSKFHKINFINEETRQAVIDCIKSGGIKEEVYLKAFIDVISQIKKGYWHDNKKNVKSKEYDIGIGKVMNVLFEVKILGKYVKRKDIKIIEIKIEYEHYSRKVLDRY
jgi:hypothetical protein